MAAILKILALFEIHNGQCLYPAFPEQRFLLVKRAWIKINGIGWKKFFALQDVVMVLNRI